MGGLESIPIFVFDFEGNSREGILEYGIVRLVDGTIENSATRFCFYQRGAKFWDSQTKIDSNEITRARPIEEDFLKFFGWRQEGIFAAHNSHCEDALLRSTWAIPGFVPDFQAEPVTKTNCTSWGPWIDSEILFKRLEQPLPSYHLHDLIAFCKLEGKLEKQAQDHCPVHRRKYHCALFDALAAALLLNWLQAKHRLTPLQLLWHSSSVKTQRQQAQLPLF